MSVFLRLSDRYEAGLKTFDPFEGERVFRLVDPWPGGGEGAALPWRRAAALVLFLAGPVWLASWADSRLLGRSGLVFDVGFYGVTVFAVLSVVFIPLGMGFPRFCRHGVYAALANSCCASSWSS